MRSKFTNYIKIVVVWIHAFGGQAVGKLQACQGFHQPDLGMSEKYNIWCEDGGFNIPYGRYIVVP